MKKVKNLYYILTYIFFIWPPFIWGLVSIYKEGNKMEIHIVSLLFNIGVVLAIVVTCWVLNYTKKIDLPTSTEIKYLMFGLIGNIVVYFYTFQNFMEIQNIVNVYLALLIILIVHYFLISRKITAWELWILLPIFLVIDYFHLLITGCGFTPYNQCVPNNNLSGLLYFLYIIIFLTVFIFYVYKIYLYKLWNFFKIINIISVIIISFAIQEFFEINENIIGTVAIVMVFFTIVDLIVQIIEKTYTHKTLLFYIRTYSILLLFSLLAEGRFFKGFANKDMLIIMVVFTYISLFINILKSVLRISVKSAQKENNEKFIIESCTETHKVKIHEQYGPKYSNFIELNSSEYTLVAIKEDTIVGFISAETKVLDKPLDTIKEVYIKVLEVNKEYEMNLITTKMITMTEKHFMDLGINQIRGWASSDNTDLIDYFSSLDYIFTNEAIYMQETKTKNDGYFYIKKLT